MNFRWRGVAGWLLVLVWLALGGVTLMPDAALGAQVAPAAGRPAANGLAEGLGTITDLDLSVELTDAGRARVQATLTWEGPEGSGPVLPLVRRVSENRDWDRLYTYTDFTLGGGRTGEVEVKEYQSVLGVQLPAQGPGEYLVSFDVSGPAKPAVPGAGPDLWEWDLLAVDGLVDQVASLAVTVDGPARPTLVRCWRGAAGEKEPCRYAATELDRAVYRVDAVGPGEGAILTVGYPNGTLSLAEPQLVRAGGPLWFLRFHHAPWAWVLAGALGFAMGASLAVRRVRRGVITASDGAAGVVALDLADGDPAAAGAGGGGSSRRATARLAWRGTGGVMVCAAAVLAAVGLGLGATGLLGPAAGLLALGVLVFALAESAPPPRG